MFKTLKKDHLSQQSLKKKPDQQGKVIKVPTVENQSNKISILSQQKNKKKQLIPNPNRIQGEREKITIRSRIGCESREKALHTKPCQIMTTKNRANDLVESLSLVSLLNQLIEVSSSGW